jgi:hypothetical protein
MAECSLTNAGDAFIQEVSSGEDADQREADDVVFAANHTAESFFQFSGFVRNGDSGLGRH